MFIATLFVISQKLETTKCPSKGEWDKQIVLYTHNGIPSISKKNELLIHAMTWISHKINILSERKPPKKYILNEFIYIKLQNMQTIVTESRLKGDKDWRKDQKVSGRKDYTL